MSCKVVSGVVLFRFTMTKTSIEEISVVTLVLGQIAWIIHVSKEARKWNGLHQVTA
jgi:hypothetical protein